MKLNHMVAPLVFGALTLAGAQAQAAGTDAGTIISNTATLDFKVNGAAQTAITATKDFKVDVKIDFTLARAAGVDSTTSTTPITLTGQTGEFYLVGAFDLTNATNSANTASSRFSLSAADVASTTTFTEGSNTYEDNIDLATANAYVIFAGTGTTPAGNAITEVNIDEGSTQRLLVYANKNDVVGTDKDQLMVSLTTQSTNVTIVDGASTTAVAVPDDDSSANTDSGVEFVFADGSGANLGGNSETTLDVLSFIFPDLSVDPSDPTNPLKNGLIKKSEVLWDPINGAKSAGKKPKAIPGAVVRYTIEVRNLGNAAASHVVVVDNIPANTTYCSTQQTGVTDFDCVVLAVTGDAALLGSDPAFVQSTSAQTYDSKTYNADANGTVFVHYPTFNGLQTADDPASARLSTITFDVIINP